MSASVLTESKYFSFIVHFFVVTNSTEQNPSLKS